MGADRDLRRCVRRFGHPLHGAESLPVRHFRGQHPWLPHWHTHLPCTLQRRLQRCLPSLNLLMEPTASSPVLQTAAACCRYHGRSSFALRPPTSPLVSAARNSTAAITIFGEAKIV